MPFKIILFFILSMLSSVVLALDGHDFKIMSEKIESSPGVIGKFVPHAASISRRVVQAFSQTRDANGRVMEVVNLRGNHSVNISNLTSKPQTYTYKFELICDGQYFRKTETVIVAPGGYVAKSDDSYLSIKHLNPGSWPISATTDISGAAMSHASSTARLSISLS